VEGEMGTAKHKLEVLSEAGAHVARTFQDIPKILGDLGI
jgi:succinyl-CoA synthetase alpha subunit